MKTFIHTHDKSTYKLIRILYVSTTNVHIYSYLFMSNQTDPDWDETPTEQTSLHRVFYLKGASYNIIFIKIKHKSTFFSVINLIDSNKCTLKRFFN